MHEAKIYHIFTLLLVTSHIKGDLDSYAVAHFERTRICNDFVGFYKSLFVSMLQTLHMVACSVVQPPRFFVQQVSPGLESLFG